MRGSIHVITFRRARERILVPVSAKDCRVGRGKTRWEKKVVARRHPKHKSKHLFNGNHRRGSSLIKCRGSADLTDKEEEDLREKTLNFSTGVFCKKEPLAH